MIAVRSPVLTEAQVKAHTVLQEHTTSALTSIFNTHRLAVEIGNNSLAKSYRKMFGYLRRNQYFDAESIAKKIDDVDHSKRLKEIREIYYEFRGPVVQRDGYPE